MQTRPEEDFFLPPFPTLPPEGESYIPLSPLFPGFLSEEKERPVPPDQLSNEVPTPQWATENPLTTLVKATVINVPLFNKLLLEKVTKDDFGPNDARKNESLKGFLGLVKHGRSRSPSILSLVFSTAKLDYVKAFAEFFKHKQYAHLLPRKGLKNRLNELIAETTDKTFISNYKAWSESLENLLPSKKERGGSMPEILKSGDYEEFEYELLQRLHTRKINGRLYAFLGLNRKKAGTESGKDSILNYIFNSKKFWFLAYYVTLLFRHFPQADNKNRIQNLNTNVMNLYQGLLPDLKSEFQKLYVLPFDAEKVQNAKLLEKPKLDSFSQPPLGILPKFSLLSPTSDNDKQGPSKRFKF